MAYHYSAQHTYLHTYIHTYMPSLLAYASPPSIPKALTGSLWIVRAWSCQHSCGATRNVLQKQAGEAEEMRSRPLCIADAGLWTIVEQGIRAGWRIPSADGNVHAYRYTAWSIIGNFTELMSHGIAKPDLDHGIGLGSVSSSGSVSQSEGEGWETGPIYTVQSSIL